MSDTPPDIAFDDQEDSSQGDGQELSVSARQLFSGISMRGPLEELERVYQNRARGLKSSGSQDQVDRLVRGFEIARDRLSVALGQGGESEQEDAQQPEEGEGLDE